MSLENFALAISSPSPSSTAADAVLSVSKGVGFLPRLQVFSGNNDVVKEGKIGVGVMGLIHDKDSAPEDLGKEVDVILIAFRTKALDMSDKANDNIFSYYDHNSEAFKKVAARSEIKNSGCMHGPEFLVWIPSAGEHGKFATLYLGTVSFRKETAGYMDQMSDGNGNYKIATATVFANFVRTAKYSWHTPKCKPCSTQIDLLPDPEEAKTVIENFNNPSASVVEKAEEPVGGGRVR